MTDLTKLVDSLFWYGFLVCVLLCSFITQSYQTITWLWFSVLFYSFVAMYCVSLIWHGQYNQRAIKAAWPLLFLWLMGIVWLFIQTRCMPGFVLDLPALGAMGVKGLGGSDVLVKPGWLESSCTFSMTPLKTWWLLLENVFILIWLLVTLSLVRTRKRLKQLLSCLLLVIAVHATAGIIAKYTNTLLVDKSTLDGHFFVARAWFVNRNHFAAFLNMGLFACLVIILKMVYRHQVDMTLTAFIDFIMGPKVLLLFAAVVTLAASMLSQSRAGLLSFYGPSVVIIGLLAVYDRKRIPVGKLVALMLSILLMAIVLYGDGFIQRLTDDSLTLGERNLQWVISCHLIKQKIGLGYGGGSYATVFQYFREHQNMRNVVFDQAHNVYLHIWLEQGLLGLSLWLGGLLYTLYKLFNYYKYAESTLVKSVMLGSLGVILAALLQSLVDFNLQIMNIKCYFFIFVAMVFCAPYINQRTRC